MARQRIPRKKRIFIGTEGQSEKSFATWLQRLCDIEGVHIHLDVVVGQGGDSLAVVQHAVRKYRSRDRGFKSAFVLLDWDRLSEDQRQGREPRKGLRNTPLELVFMRPTLEGVLLRLHEGHEERLLSSARDANRELRKLWPGYSKPTSADTLLERFQLPDLKRAAIHDRELQSVLDMPGL